MTLNELAYEILEEIRSNKITDDEEIDVRLIKSWIHAKRAAFLKNKINGGYNINLTNAQTIDLTVAVVNTYESTTTEKYPYINTDQQKFTIFKSATKVPSILESKTGLIVMDLRGDDINKPPYNFVEFGRLIFSGNSRFNRSFVYGAIKDDYLYLQQNSGDTYLTEHPKCYLTAVFADPTKIEGYSDDSEYPCSLDVIESIKNSIFDIQFKMLRVSTEDDQNSANDEQ